MSDDIQDLWQKFNAPTIALFKKIENAADGFERLFMLMLKLSGEYLVPRPGISRYPDEYYNSFNTWLIGRLFYVWSVKELKRVHISSKDTQIKILNILSINGASFYEKLHCEYLKILLELVEYYEQDAGSQNSPNTMVLKHFVPELTKIPDTELNLEPIFVNVSSIDTCKVLIDLNLQLLANTIPMNFMSMDQNFDQYKEVFSRIIYILENFDTNIKLHTLKFFKTLIKNHDKVATTRFCYKFPMICNNLMQCIEANIASLQILYDKSDIDSFYLEQFNEALVSLLLDIEVYIIKDCKYQLVSMATTIFETNNKIFTDGLRKYFLSLSTKVELPHNVISLKSANATEINLLSEYYTKKIGDYIKDLGQEDALQENTCYREILFIIDSLSTYDNISLDNFLLNHHLERSSVALQILQRIHIEYPKINNSHLNILSKETTNVIVNSVVKILETHKAILMCSMEMISHVLDIVLSVVMLHDTKQFERFALRATCLQSTPSFSQHNLDYNDEIKVLVLKYLLLENIIYKSKSADAWIKAITVLSNSILKNKSIVSYKQIIPLTPLLLINKTTSGSKLIGDIFMPALLTKNSELQVLLCELLPVIACISLGKFAVVLTTRTKDNIGHKIFTNGTTELYIVCTKCNNEDRSKISPETFLNHIQTKHFVLSVDSFNVRNDSTVIGQRSLFAKFLKLNAYPDIDKNNFLNLVECFSNHGIFNNVIATEIFNERSSDVMLKGLRNFSDNIEFDENIESSEKESIFNICINLLVHSTKTCLESNDYNKQTHTLDSIRHFGLSNNSKVLLPSTKLLVYFIMHLQCPVTVKAVVYLRDICEAHNYTPNQVYHRYKKDYCRLFVDCSLYNGQHFASSLLKVVHAFGFVGFQNFISKDVHHFLPYLIPYSVKVKEVTSIIEVIASHMQCTVADFLIERFAYMYIHLYLYESESVAEKCYRTIEKLTNNSLLYLIKKHFRVILTEFLLHYNCNPERVLKACRYLAIHDPDASSPSGTINMSISQVADFLQPKFLGVLAYFDQKLVNAKVALSVKRKALQSFPHLMQLMGVKYLTDLRYKVLATLRSALILANEFPKILALAWSAFIHNIDSKYLGPLLPNLAVSLIQQIEYAPHEINKIFHYLVLNNENLLSCHLPDLFFLEDSKIPEKVKIVIKRHVKRTQPEGFLDKLKWYLNNLKQDIPNVKAYAFSCLDKLLRNNRTEIHKAIFGGRNIDPVIVELIECLLIGCKDSEATVSCASGACLGQLGAIEAAHLPRQYVALSQKSPFAFSIVEDSFAVAALHDLARAFQFEINTMNMNCYALTIQQILKTYDISPTGNKKEIWDGFPEHMHQIMFPLLSSRYIACPSQPKQAHPLFGSAYATTFLEWAYNWSGQLIPLIEKENIRGLMRTVLPSMRRDQRTLLLFLPYVLLHAIMSQSNTQYIEEELLAVIGLESFHNENRVNYEKNECKLLRHVRLTPSIRSIQTEEGNQNKCCKMIYKLFDFLNRWLLEYCDAKPHPLLNENYKTISTFLNKFDKLTIAKGNFMCGEFERALQYLELYMAESNNQMETQLPFLAEIYALLDEPDSVAGILSMKRSEPSLKELILAQVVTGRLQDAALCYERLAQQGQLDRHSLQGMIDCYLGLDQPFTAYRLLNDHGSEWDNMAELAAEPLWRLGRFEELEELVKNPVPPSRENWGLLMGKILLSFRSGDRDAFETSCKNAMGHVLSLVEGKGKGESALRNCYQSVFALHIITEASHAEDALYKLKEGPDFDREGESLLQQLLNEWRSRAAIVQSDVRTLEPLLRARRILLHQTQELLRPTHPVTANKLKTCIGDIWLHSAKYARKAGNFQQAYMYILNAEEYQPEELFIEKAKMYWARNQQEQAFTTLKRGLDESYPLLDSLTRDQRKICAKAKLLIAKYNDETTNVDVDVNIGYYKEAVDVFKQWEKSLVSLGAYYEKVSGGEKRGAEMTQVWTRRVAALNSYGKALQYGHKYLYQSMPRMLSIWLDVEVSSADQDIRTVLAQMTEIIKTYSERLPLYLYLTAFSQIVSRICHPVKEVYMQLKAIIVKLIVAYPQHTLWKMMSVIKSNYPERMKRCQDVFRDPNLKEPRLLKLMGDFTNLAEKLIELCNKPLGTNASSTTVTTLVRMLPRLLAANDFSHIMMPYQEFCKIVLPSKAARQEKLDFHLPSEPPVYIAGIDEHISILPSLQKPRKVTLRGSDGKPYIIMLKPRDDLRKDYRLMEFNDVVNRFLQDTAETRRRRLYIRTYSVLPLNEECGVIEWVPNLLGLRPILLHIYKQKGLQTSNRELREMMCSNKDPVEKKRRIFLEQLLPRHPPVFQEWFRRVFSDPYGWYQARSAYIRTTAVISMVGYILGLGDRHGENISFDSTNGDTVHVDFNCLFNRGETFEWPERVPFRLTRNMEAAMGPLKHEGMFRKSSEAVMRALRAQTAALMSVVGPFVYDPLVSWGKARQDCGERTNEQAMQHLAHIRQRLNGMVRTKNKQLSLSLSPEGQVEHLIVEATSIDNLCQMYIGWGPFL